MKKLILRIGEVENLEIFLNFIGVDYAENIKAVHFDDLLNPVTVEYKKRSSRTVSKKPTHTMAFEHWVDMPEFVQEKIVPLATIEIFVPPDLLQDFAVVVEQKLTLKTKSLWFPHKPHKRAVRHCYV